MTTLNMIPSTSRHRLEHLRQARRWIVAGLAMVVALGVAHFVVARATQEAAEELTLAEESFTPLRRAEAEAERRRAAGAAVRQKLEVRRIHEQADAPLAILQTIADARHAVGPAIEVGSLRVDETAAGQPSSGNAGATLKTPPSPRKQVMLAGMADDDACVSALADALHASGMFQRVEIEASQAASEQEDARRTFQIRCQQ